MHPSPSGLGGDHRDGFYLDQETGYCESLHPNPRAGRRSTLEETLERGGDDCDGLELLVNQALRDLGFSQDEVFRAIVYRPSDGQHHMVTFWFEERNDPWVIDPTGAMTAGMPRMSDLPEWRPLKVFSEQREFTVRAVRTDLRP